MNIPPRFSKKCTVSLSNEQEYIATTKIWNSSLQFFPEQVFYPKNHLEIQEVVKLSSELRKSVSIKNGGHSPIGASIAGDHVIDMKYMNHHTLNQQESTLVIDAGLKSHHVNTILSNYSLGLPIGTCPFVGMTGLTLGGGIGLLSRKFGLTCDNVLSFKLIDGQGKNVVASLEENQDLFRALKGGGHCNFGVVYQLTYRVYPVPKNVMSGTIAFPITAAATVLTKYLQTLENDDRDLFLYCSMNNDYFDKPTIQIFGLCLGSTEEAKSLFHNISSWDIPCYNDIKKQTYHDIQGSYAEHVPDFPKLKWKSGFIKSGLKVDSNIKDDLIDCFQRRPNKHCRCHIDPLGGAIADVPEKHSAFINRNSPFLISILAIWNDDESEKVASVKWARTAHKKLSKYFQSSGHANYDDSDIDRGDSYYNEYQHQLITLKKKYDPNNIYKGSIKYEDQ